MEAIIISGMPAVGKTSVAKAIAKKYQLEHHCGGDALRIIISDKGISHQGIDWWDTAEGMNFLEKRKINHEFDRLVDKKLGEIAKNGNVVISSYPLPWLIKEGLKIWLQASPQNRAQRMAKRDNISFNKALEIVKRRDLNNIDLYKKVYGISFGEDLSVFDFVICTNELQQKAVIEIVLTIIKQFK